ncbi:T9SS type A sorting domain-containing protein [Marinirhabdus gelatinilytica]|uniref:Putative secreted protein (Por secretion system target) n=1 Tax=Marinirhabdus gelatinilytica TaxID=1703343 RepID=A0A370Q740_9FLAO|nr:T9SS type A sorting domain-containing protein [Marinirhabdus gelatinilytica]RDK84171.1 putative secreted protein (Por secretion system target) [Marinirhabdus gelatinilytica]
MSKKLLSGLVLSFFAISAFAQTIVSTTPEDKKVILEEFTGINCVFCPDGHAIAQAIQDDNPGNVFLINIHTGGFANPSGGQPDFRTPFGSAIADQSGLVGYPAGTVNRHIFPGQSQSGDPDDTAMSRGAWAGASNDILGQASYLNMAVEAEVDVQTNELTVHVEAYYTGDSPEATNMLNVALLQNNTLGPQTGGNMGNEYVRQHRLVHLITGQWGESVSPTTATSFIDRTYTYTIPAGYNSVPVELADLELVVFMTETTQEIISGNGAYPTFTNLANADDVNLRSIQDVPELCAETLAPVINIQNNGANDLTSLDIEYSINGGTPETYTWTGLLTSLQNEDVELPEVSFTMQATNTIDVTIPNDDDNSNNDATSSFDQAVNGTGTVYMELNTDQYGSEVRWNVTDVDGNVLYNGGPYGNNTTINETFQLDAGCHTFNLIDTYGDGGGAVTLTDSDGTEIYSTNGAYGSGESQNFGSDGVQILSVGEVTAQQVVIYPNPATDVLNVKNAETGSIAVFDILGKKIIELNDLSLNEAINVSTLQAGTYLVKISVGGTVTTEKFIISR